VRPPAAPARWPAAATGAVRWRRQPPGLALPGARRDPTAVYAEPV